MQLKLIPANDVVGRALIYSPATICVVEWVEGWAAEGWGVSKWRERARGEHRFMKLMKYKIKGKISDVFHFAGKRFFINIFMKSLHGEKWKKKALIYTTELRMWQHAQQQRVEHRLGALSGIRDLDLVVELLWELKILVRPVHVPICLCCCHVITAWPSK
jgi:hypothetical protein